MHQYNIGDIVKITNPGNNHPDDYQMFKEFNFYDTKTPRYSSTMASNEPCTIIGVGRHKVVGIIDANGNQFVIRTEGIELIEKASTTPAPTEANILETLSKLTTDLQLVQSTMDNIKTAIDAIHVKSIGNINKEIKELVVDITIENGNKESLIIGNTYTVTNLSQDDIYVDKNTNDTRNPMFTPFPVTGVYEGLGSFKLDTPITYKPEFNDDDHYGDPYNPAFLYGFSVLVDDDNN